ncbi:MAG: hypothetical protein Q7T83_00465 [Thermodesulfovibrionales bacterium]|nr:hypothetical protein [Thermodesulfovibrionales bacterium]
MNKIRALIIGFFVLFISASITEYLYYAMIETNKRFINNYDLFMFIWLLIPYLIMGCALRKHHGAEDKPHQDKRSIFITSIIGVLLSAEILAFQPDPFVIGLILPLVPLLQLIIFFILSLINMVLRRRHKEAQERNLM